MQCSNCGHGVGDEDVACGRCGSGTGYVPKAKETKSATESKVVETTATESEPSVTRRPRH